MWIGKQAVIAFLNAAPNWYPLKIASQIKLGLGK